MSRVLVDASIWIDHLRAANTDLVGLLANRSALGHPWVIGEVALGSLADRAGTIQLLTELPPATTATHAEAMAMISEHRLFGRGLGYVDTHLLAATRLTTGARLWTRDRRLREAATDLGVAFTS